MREFRPLDYVLLASGCKIFQSDVTRVLDRVQKVLLLIVVLYFFGKYAPWIFRRGISKFILIHAWPLSDACFALIFITVMSLRRKKMRVLLETMAKHIDDTRRDSLRQYAVISSVLTWIAVARLLVFSVIIFFNPHIDEATATYILITSYGHLISWLFGGIAVYGFFVKSITYMEEEFFDRVENIIHNTLAWSPDGLSVENREIMHLKGEIVACFGPIPCLWLVHTFVRAAGIMFTHGTDKQLTKMTTLTIDVAALVWLIFLCDRSKEKSDQRSSSIVLQILRKGEADNWKVLIHELEQAARVNFTFWNMFTIKKVVIPVFLGSLANFMVLISKLIQDLSANNQQMHELVAAKNQTY